jgi:type IV secretory pathway VirB9-like protein
MRLLPAVLLASVSVLGLCHRAVAEETAPDAQIKVVAYSPLKRTAIVGIVGQPTTITFPKGESIYRVVQSGKPEKDGSLADAGWQGPTPEQVKDTPLGNNLTLWPAKPGQSTMSVITMSSDGVQKVYPFLLVAVPDDASALTTPGVVLNLIFQGSAPIGTTVASGSAPHVWSPAKRAELESAKQRLRADAFNGTDGKCNYEAKGKQPNDITPLCPLDNGEWTLMRFPGLSKKPAVYVVTGADNKDERLARQHGDADFVVVEEIAARFRLRLGTEVIDIINKAYSPSGKPTGTDTIAPTVQRDILQAKAAP